MTTKRPSELDVQDRVADAIWFVPQSDETQAHYVLEYSGRGPKAYLNLWLGKHYGEELTEWNWVLHESAVELWRRDSTDEEIIDVLLPDNDLRAENKRLRDILGGMADLPTWAEEMGGLQTENERLRTAARRVLDAWDDNLPTQEEIEALREALGRDKK